MDHSTPAVDCAVAAGRYLKRFGWPCTAHGAAVWTLAGEAIDALDVPARFGPATLSALRRQTGCPHDVIEVPTGTWRFLVAARRQPLPSWVSDLAGHGVVYLTNADRIELPPTRVVGGELRWVRDPTGDWRYAIEPNKKTLSPLHVVVTVLAQVVLDETDGYGANTTSTER